MLHDFTVRCLLGLPQLGLQQQLPACCVRATLQLRLPLSARRTVNADDLSTSIRAASHRTSSATCSACSRRAFAAPSLVAEATMHSFLPVPPVDAVLGSAASVAAGRIAGEGPGTFGVRGCPTSAAPRSPPAPADLRLAPGHPPGPQAEQPARHTSVVAVAPKPAHRGSRGRGPGPILHPPRLNFLSPASRQR